MTAVAYAPSALDTMPVLAGRSPALDDSAVNALAVVVAERDAALRRVAELEYKVKDITSRGADFLLERNELAREVAEFVREVARLTERCDATDLDLIAVTRERDELRQLLDGARAAMALPACHCPAEAIR